MASECTVSIFHMPGSRWSLVAGISPGACLPGSANGSMYHWESWIGVRRPLEGFWFCRSAHPQTVTTKQIIIIDLSRSTYSVPTIDYRGTGRAVLTGGRCCAWYEKGLEGVCALVGTEYGRILYTEGCLSLTGKLRKPSDIQEREVWIVGYSGIRARLRRRSSITPVWVPIGDSW